MDKSPILTAFGTNKIRDYVVYYGRFSVSVQVKHKLNTRLMEDDNFGFLDESHSYKVDFVINLNISWIPIKSPWNMKSLVKY